MNHPILNNYKLVSELAFAKFYLSPDGETLVVRYNQSTDLTLEMAEQVIEIAFPFAKAGAKFGITDATSSYLNISSKARAYYKNNKANQFNKAHAVVVKSLTARLLANFFTNIDKPPMPLKVFNDFDSALIWLKEIEA